MDGLISVKFAGAFELLSLTWHTFFIQIFDLHWWDAKKNFKRTYQAAKVPASEGTVGVINHHREQNFRNKKRDKILLFYNMAYGLGILV